jgi:ribosomal protein S14
MARRCQVTGREPAFGNNVSHSHRRTRLYAERRAELAHRGELPGVRKSSW